MLRILIDMVTNIFPDGKISRLSAETLAKVEPQLGIFALRFARCSVDFVYCLLVLPSPSIMPMTV